MPRSVEDIEAEIAAIKSANPNWISNDVDKALITALENRIASTAAAAAPAGKPRPHPLLQLAFP